MCNSKGKKIRKEFYGKNKSKAEHKKEKYKQDLKNGINKAAENEVLNDAFNTWLVDVILPSGIKISTYETYESIYRLYVKDSKLGIRKIKGIKPIMVQTFLSEILALKWDDIDMENRTLNIKKSIRYTKDFDSNGEAIGEA